MAKLKQPLLSFAGQGKLGAITYRRGNRVNIAEKTPKPADVKSAEQLSWRTMFEKCTLLWSALSAAEKQVWESLARPRHMTGYALWQSQCLRPNPGIYLPLAGGTMQGNIVMATHAITGLLDPSAAQDADTKAARDTAIAAALYTQGCRVYNNAHQNIPTGVLTAVALNSERYDTDAMHSTTINNSRVTFKTAGKYIIVFHGRFAPNAVGVRALIIRLNAGDSIGEVLTTPCLTDATDMCISTIYNMVIDDYIEGCPYQTSGGDIAFQYVVQYSPILMAQRIG